MKFGDFLVFNAVPQWRAQYLHYKTLTELIEGAPQSEEYFTKVISDELNRIDRFVGGKVIEAVSNMKMLETATADDALAESTAHLLDLLDIFLRQNIEAIRKLMKKYVKKTGYSKAWFEEKRSERWIFKASAVMHEMVVQLSCYYKRLIDDSNESWKPPASFSRHTTKYWVPMEYVTKLKLLIIKHLPILELQNSSSVKIDFEKQRLDQTHNFISSVYLDNDTLDSYHERIQQLEGSQLFRIRWYGGKLLSDDQSLPVPDPAKVVFVERKTHHEKWVGEESKKERFPLDVLLLEQFCSGAITPEKAFEIMTLRGMLNVDDINMHLELAHEVQDSIVQRHLTPKIRTVYHRTAFQRSSSNQVRISFDSPCYFVEQSSEGFDFSAPYANQNLEPFKYGILEIKLVGEEPPAWISDILNCDWLTKVDKFSKFQTSTNMHYSNVRIKPHWMESLQAPQHDTLSDSKVESSEVLWEDTEEVLEVIDDASQQHRNKPLVSKNVKADTVIPKRTNLQRTKIEPKTYFANERTFIQWLSAAILLVTLSTAVMSINETARIAGTVFFPVALVFMFYALGVYQWRLDKINNRDGTRFDDPFGPWALTILLSTAMVATVALIWTRDFEAESSSDNQFSFDTSVDDAAAPLPLSYLEIRHNRCIPTPTEASVPPTSWELQEDLQAHRFATFQGRERELRQLESRIKHFYHVTKLTVTWEKTEDRYCIPTIFDCNQHYVRNRRNTREAILKQHNVNNSFTAPVISSDREFEEKYELDSYCDRNTLAYSVKIQYNETMSSPWNLTNILNDLLQEPFYPPNELMILNATYYSVNYEYKLRDAAVGGADAEANLEIQYNSSDERALAVNPVAVQLQLRLEGDVGVTAVRHAEALLEYLVSETNEGSSSSRLSDGAIVIICVAAFLCLLVAVAICLRCRRQGKPQMNCWNLSGYRVNPR